jgi:hypothetical protein
LRSAGARRGGQDQLLPDDYAEWATVGPAEIARDGVFYSFNLHMQKDLQQRVVFERQGLSDGTYRARRARGERPNRLASAPAVALDASGTR